jgi:tetratricopeptide (TPR) repeat protein
MNPFRKSLLALIVVAAPVVASACGNEYYTSTDLPLTKGTLNIQAMLHHADSGKVGYFPYWWFGFGDNVQLQRYRLAEKIDPKKASYKMPSLPWATLEQALQKNIDYKILSDYAWGELRIGNKANAVKLLERLYAKYPNEYNVLANLGTAYEVTGKNQKALELLRKAIAINPASHYHSEWIHIKILEQKIAKQPNYTSMIGLKAGDDYAEWLSAKGAGTVLPPDSLLHQIAFQLHERISFIKAPDKVVGQLVLDFADLVAVTHSRAKAKEFYTYALKYDPLLKKKIDARLKTVLQMDATKSREPQ